MTRILLDADTMDGTSRELRAIGADLDVIEKKLGSDLAAGVPSILKAQVIGILVDVRKGVERKADSARNQAGELKIRAAMTRLAAGEGTMRDVAILLSITAGAGAINPKKRRGLAADIDALRAGAIRGPIVAPGASARDPNAVDRAMTRWAKWMERHGREGSPFGKGTLSKVRDQVLGKRVTKAEMTGPVVSNPGKGWPADPAATAPAPLVDPPADTPSGGVSIDAAAAGPGTNQRAPDASSVKRHAQPDKPLIRRPDRSPATA